MRFITVLLRGIYRRYAKKIYFEFVKILEGKLVKTTSAADGKKPPLIWA